MKTYFLYIIALYIIGNSVLQYVNTDQRRSCNRQVKANKSNMMAQWGA
jgi:hypothetical protein